MSSTTIFEKIIAREIPAHFFYEDDVCVGIMDRAPVTPGQCLIIPTEPTEYIFDLDEKTYAHLFAVVKKVGPVLDSIFETTKTCIVVEGFEVPHVHIKLFPMTVGHLEIQGGTEADDATLATHAARISAGLDAAG